MEPSRSASVLGVNSFEVETEVTRRMDSSPRRSVVEGGRIIVLAISHRAYWEKQLHYALKFLIRSSREQVVLLHFTGPKGLSPEMSTVLESAKAKLLSSKRVNPGSLSTEIFPLEKHSVHSALVAYCQRKNAEVLVLGTIKPEPSQGFFSFHRHAHVEEHCRQALITTKVVHVAPPADAAEA